MKKINKYAVFIIILILPLVSAQDFNFSSPLTGNAVRCFSDYECGEWGACLEGLQSRVCIDQKCARRNIIERRFCQIPGCSPKIECTDWSECIYTEKISDLINGKISFGGYHNRICRDANECVESFMEEKPCEEFYPIELKKVEQCNQEFLAGIDPSSERIVAKINLDSWKKDRLDITFSQGDSSYCSNCYNGIKDFNEEEIDCGGSCKPCMKQSVFPSKLAMIAFWMFSGLFTLLFIREIITFKKMQVRYGSWLR